MNLIEINPHIMLGKPVLAGTRITVESLLERLAAGEREADILEAHPQLKPEHIRASLHYAAATLRNEEAYIVTTLAA
ncbi:MAG: DUF433 domain-containing protein [Pseudomonadota bacterium]